MMINLYIIFIFELISHLMIYILLDLMIYFSLNYIHTRINIDFFYHL